jgi:hypothetical protein
VRDASWHQKPEHRYTRCGGHACAGKIMET